jgi:hypothetical protein
MSVTNENIDVDIPAWRQTVCLTLDPKVIFHIDNLRGGVNRSRYIEHVLIDHIMHTPKEDKEND